MCVWQGYIFNNQPIVVKNLYITNGGEAYSGKDRLLVLMLSSLSLSLLSLRISECCHQALYIIYIKNIYYI